MIDVTERLKRIQTPYVRADLHKCEACWRCVGVCPEKIIGKVGLLWHKHIVFKDSDNCSGCRKCIRACPYGVFTQQI
ncbi:MAG: 4Fe-4S binding protein [Bacteroidales bacterium]|nr:4Fe-4S binding protein [Bacteroidales bacterium]